MDHRGKNVLQIGIQKLSQTLVDSSELLVNMYVCMYV